MSMTRTEYVTRDYIQKKLAREGYPTYASILGNFDLNITKNPTVVGYMEPDKGRIVLNSGLDENQVSVIVRHEILHQFLEHERRLLKKLCQEHNLDFDKVDDNSLKDIKKKLYSNDLFNIAADYEISNRGYTDKDKDIVRNILLNGQVLTGLVTEDEHPDWVDMSVEEMYDALRDNKDQQQQDQEGSNDQQDQNQQGQEGQGSESSGEEDQQQQDQGGGSSGDNQQQDQGDNSQDSGSSDSQGDQSEEQSDDGGSGDSGSTDNLDSDDSEGSGDSSSQDKDNSKQGSGGPSDDSSSSNQSGESSKDKQNQGEAQSGNPGDSEDGSSNGKVSSGKKPQIGDKGDEEFTAIEDEERERKAAEEATKYDLPNESDEEKQERLKRISRDMSDAQTARNISSEAEDKVKGEKAKRAAMDAGKYTNSPIKRFRDNLNRFVRNEVGRERTRTWKKENPSYEGSGIMRRGKAKTSNGKIPSINVYFDRSGSWDAAKTQVGQDAIATLNNYVKNGQIKINLYYFNTEIHSEDPGGRGGTRGTPIVEHIKQTKPDNVIIMTDNDIRDIDESVTVPGAVWLLFKGGKSKNLIDHIHGRKQTNIYDLD